MLSSPYIALISITIFAGACVRPSVPPVSPTLAPINAGDLRRGLTAFAHDTMMGREAGTIWNERATEFVGAQFRRLGVRPAGDNGTYFQIVPNLQPRDPTVPKGVARNVIGLIPGTDPTVRNEYVSITAHNDHIGYSREPVDHDSLKAYNTVVRPMGADSRRREMSPVEAARIRTMVDSGRRAHSPRADSIFNGADDDGSGTIALIAIAKAFMTGHVKPRRSILLVSHTGEEKGLRGSDWFTDHPTIPIDSIVAEIDLDMVGRGAATDLAGGGPTYLEVVGLRRLSNEFGDMLVVVNARQPVPFAFNYEFDAPGHPEQYYCRADHYSYARYGIPSVSVSRGGHMDYHMVTDEAQYIDYVDYARLTQMIFDAAVFVANADHAPRVDGPRPANPHVPCKQ